MGGKLYGNLVRELEAQNDVSQESNRLSHFMAQVDLDIFFLSNENTDGRYNSGQN